MEWSSKQKPIVTTSSTEAEYVSLSYMIKEILFIKGIIEFIKVKLQILIKVNVDNKGAIFISKIPLLKELRTSIQDTISFVNTSMMESSKSSSSKLTKTNQISLTRTSLKIKPV